MARLVRAPLRYRGAEYHVLSPPREPCVHGGARPRPSRLLVRPQVQPLRDANQEAEGAGSHHSQVSVESEKAGADAWADPRPTPAALQSRPRPSRSFPEGGAGAASMG